MVGSWFPYDIINNLQISWLAILAQDSIAESPGPAEGDALFHSPTLGFRPPGTRLHHSNCLCGLLFVYRI